MLVCSVVLRYGLLRPGLCVPVLLCAVGVSPTTYSAIDMSAYSQHTLGVHQKEAIAILSFQVSEVSEEIWGPGIENDEAI